MVDWLQLSQNSGYGRTYVTITASSYSEFVERATGLLISGQTLSTSVTITQECLTPPALSVSPSTVSLTSAGSTFNVTVTAEANWTASTASDWFSFSPTTGSSGTTTIVATANTNNTLSSRTNTISVTDNYSTKLCTVTQAHRTPVLEISPTSFSCTTATTSFTLSVSAETDWTAVSYNWITLSQSAGTSGVSTINVTIADNTGLTREERISVTDNYNTKRCRVSQDGIRYDEYPIVTYRNVTSTTEDTQIWHPNYAQEEYILGTTMVVDGEIVPIAKKYRFSSVGQHIVRFQYHGYQSTQSTIRYTGTLGLGQFNCSSLVKFEVDAGQGSWFWNNITAVTHTIGDNYNNRPDLDCHCDVVDLRKSNIQRAYGVFIGPNVNTLYLPSTLTTMLGPAGAKANANLSNAHTLADIYCEATTAPTLSSGSDITPFSINDSFAQQASAYTGVARVGTLHVPSESSGYTSTWMANRKGRLGYQPANPNVPRYNWTLVGDL